MRPRDPAKTKARILAAATNEFAALFEAIVGKLLSDQQQAFAGAPTEIEDKIAFHFNAACPQKAKWLRLLLWESLAYGEGPVVAEHVRRGAMAKGCAQMRSAQKQGNMLPNMPAEHVTLALMAMSVFPWAFPQVTRMLTGTAPSDPAFQAQYTDVLRAMTRRLKRPEKPRPLRRIELS